MKQEKRLGYSAIFLNLFAFLFFFSLINCSPEQPEGKNNNTDSSSQAMREKISDLFTKEDVWSAPDTSSIPLNDSGKMILFGKALITNTAEFLGPKGSLMRISNGMNCQNCHLDAGTKLFANSFSAVASIYPKFRPRSGSVESVEKRVNDCLERSLDGKTIDSTCKEMRAMVAYIKWVGKDVKKGEIPKGAAVVDLPYLDRAADPVKGKAAYQKTCVKCHGDDGQGKLNADSVSYQYPPLWGSYSYNTGAGIFRLTRFAGYIKSNMPYLTSNHDNPALTDEEAWDIAAFVNSMPRPDKKFKNDWPDISKKPIDHPYGPYADKFSEEQHKYGPFAEIAAEKKK